MARFFSSRVLILIVLAVGVYANTLYNGFMWDDRDLVEKNPIVQQERLGDVFSPGYWQSIPQEERGRFRPVRILTFVLDHLVYGEHPWGYHLTNILLHACDVVLFYLLAAALFGSGAAALFAALLFAVHPVHVESVAWVKNRSDLLCAAFMLLGMLSMVKLTGVRRALTVSASFALALLSKETAIMLPFMLIFIVALYFPDETRPSNIRWLTGLILASALFFGVKEVFWNKEITARTDLMMDAYIQMRIILFTVSTYIGLLLLPAGLNAEREIDFNVSSLQSVNAGFIAMFLLGVAILVLYRMRKRYPFSNDVRRLIRDAAFGYGFMLLAIIPVSNIVFLEGRPIAEQRLYIPSIGYCLLIGAIVAFALEKLRAAGVRYGFLRSVSAMFVVPYLITALFAVLSFQRNTVWKDDMTFWTEAARINPKHYRANYNLGIVYMKREDVPKAIEHFEVATKDCDRPEVYNHLARCYDAAGEYRKAIDCYTVMFNLTSDLSPDIYNNAGVVYDKMGDHANAERFYREALKIEQENSPARLNLAQLYEKLGKRELARREYRRMLHGDRLSPAYTIACRKLEEMERYHGRP